MKKLVHFMLLGLIMTLAACTKDETVLSGTGSQSITVTIPSYDMSTKASAADFGTGAKVNRCILEIYRGGSLYGERQVATVQGNQATFNLRLVASQTYDFVFWADCADGLADKHYNTADLRNITVNGDYTGNDDDFDAFFKNESGITVDGQFSLNVTLKRPFGQLNIKTKDLSSILIAELKPTDVKVSFQAMPVSFNAITGEVGTETAEVSYTAPVINAGTGELTMDYIWAPDSESNLTDFSMTFLNNGNEITTNSDFRNIPIRRNYKTNVSGNLLTKQGSISVTIDPIFPNPEYNEEIARVETVEDVKDALAEGATNVTVATAPSTDATINIPKIYSTTNESIAISIPATDKTITVQYDAEQSSGNAPASVGISIPNSDNLVIDLPQSTVTLNGTAYNTVEATTAANTLIIPEGVTVKTLTVKGGNVEIYGTLTDPIVFDNDASVIKVYSVHDAATLRAASGLALSGRCEKIALAADIELDGSEMGFTGTLDLNGKKLTFNNATGAVEVPEGASLTVTGGTLKVSRTKNTQGALIVNKDATLVFDGVNFETNAVALYPAGDAASVIVRNSAIAAETYAVSTNASTTYTVGIILEKSTFTGYSPIMVNIPCKLTMDGCRVTGSMQGVVVRGGTAKISNSEIALEYNDSDYEEMVHYFDNRDWGQGNMVNLAALTIGNKHASSYQYPTDVTLVNTKLTLGGSYGQHFPALYAYANQGEGLGVTLAYDARCQFAKAPVLGSDNITVNNAYNPWDGQSTEEIVPNASGEYEVATPAQLAWVAAAVNVSTGAQTFEGKTVKLVADIDLAGHEWTPIGNGTRLSSIISGKAFKGTFDGNGKTISNLTITTNSSASRSIGLFGNVTGGSIRNFRLKNVSIDVTSEQAGAVAGLLGNGATVCDIEVLSGHVSAAQGTAGIVGRIIKYGTVSGCTNHAAVTGTAYNIGGIVGAAYYGAEGQTMTIEGCSNYGTVSGTYGVGGIVGLSAANVSNCVNEAAITGNGSNVAGIVAEQQNAGSVKGCTNRGNITNNSSAYGTGGIVGWVRYNGATSNYPVKNVIEVSGNANYGTVNGGNDAGGIVGTVYNLGLINGNKNFAPALSSNNFAAGIVGNAQFTETPVGISDPNSVEVRNNVSTTAIDRITGRCTDLYVYINNQEFVTTENNRDHE